MDKPLRDLIEIIHFTENVSAKIHGLLDEAEIYRSVRREFAQSKRYTASILLVTDDESALRVTETSALPGKLKAIEKATGLRLRGYEIDLNKSNIYGQVVREGQTVQVNASDILGELLPRPLARLVSETMGYEERPAILTPLKRHGKVIGALAMSSTELAEHFTSSVRNLAQHISAALQLADEYAERKRAEEEIRQRTVQLEALREVRLEITSQLDLDSLLHSIVSRAIELLGGTSGGIYLCRPERDVLEWAVAIGPNVAPTGTVLHRGEGLSGKVWETGEALIVDDYQHWEGRPALYEGYPWTAVVGVPVRWGEEFLGVLDVLVDGPWTFSPADAELLSLFATQAAIAVRNARLHQEVQRRVEELTFLNRVGRAVTSSLDLEQILTTVMEETAHVLGTEAGSILLLDEESSELVFGTAVGPRSEEIKGLRFPLGQGIAGWVAREGQPSLVPNVREDPRFYSGIDGATGFVTRSVLAVPLKVKGKVIGVIEAVNKTEGNFGRADVALLSSIAKWAAIAIENAQLFVETQRRLEEMVALYDVSLDITAQLEMPELLKSIVERAVNLLRSDSGGVYLYDSEREELRLSIGYDYTEKYVGTTLKPGEGMAGKVFQSGEPMIVDDYRTWEGRAAVYEADQAFTAVLEVPLRWREQVIGVLAINADAQRRTFNQDDIWLATLFASQAATAIENARLFEWVERSEKRYRTILESSADAIVSLNADLKVAAWSTGAEQSFGYTREEIVGQSLDILVPEYDRQPTAERLKEVRQRGFVRGWETQRRAKDGRLVEVEMTVTDLGPELGYTAILRDVTERKRLEHEIEERHLYLESVLACAPDAIVTLDAQHNILEWNPGAERLFGYTLEEVVGRNIDELVTGSDARTFEEATGFTQQVLTGESVPPTETVRYRRDGSPVDVIVSGSPILIENEMVGVVAAYTDIAERKRAERLLQTLNEAALAMGQALTPGDIFAVVAEELKKLGFSCAVFLTDGSQTRLFPKYLSYEAGAIQAAEKLVGLKHEDFSIPIERVGIYRNVVWGKKANFLESAAEDIMRQVLPESVKRFARQIAKMLKIPKSIAAPLIVEDQVIGVLSVQSDDLTEGDVPAITAFAHQMAAAWQKAQLMQDLQNSLEDLKRTQAQLLQAQKMEAIGQLAAGIAHDFNNLLTPIGGFAELLLWKAPKDSQQQEYLRQIKAAAERAATLTRQLRLFTRQTAGERHPLQLNSLVEETRALLERSLPKEIALELHLASELWAVEADPSQISQVLMNLCLNARDAMPDGGTLTLKTGNVILDEEYARRVLEARPGRYVRLSVSDTGCGMSLEVQARLFEPFFTTKEVGEGTGLGLAVVYGIVKGHGGFIQVYSQKGRGSTFHVYLPAIEAAVEEREVAGLELPSGRETILVVDDEEMVRALGRRVLERCGYTVLMAEDGVQALEVYREHQGEIALVVLDVVMPEMGGRECLRHLRELDPQVKVLISTGYTAKGMAEELVAEGALEVVEKPFQIQDFATAVRTTIDG